MTTPSALATATGLPLVGYEIDANGSLVALTPDLGPVAIAYCAAVLRGETEATLAAACRWECRRRILERYSETDQTNAQRRATVLLRRFAAGTATAQELAEGDALEQASDWIDAMTAHWRTLAAAGRSPFAPDAAWPVHP